MGTLIALVLIMGLIDLPVFTNLDKISKQLDPIAWPLSRPYLVCSWLHSPSN